MNIGILESLLISGIALEADDITKKVNDTLGGKDAPTEKATDDQREEDLTQTDGIFNDIGKDDADDNPQANPVNDNNEGSNADEISDSLGGSEDTNEDESNDDTENTPEGDESNIGDSDLDNSDDPTMDTEEGQNPEDKSIFSDKNTLKKNMIYFFNIIRYTITSLEDGIGNTENQETIRVINSITQNLYSTKDVLYNLITKDMEKTPYETLVTKYITIKRIYDISCDMLEEHFKTNPNGRIKYKRFKKKSK